jgi:hypothetical protein
MAQAVYSLTTSEKRKLAVLMRMALDNPHPSTCSGHDPRYAENQ